ncbi:M20 family metallopeptidase [Terrabacter carboxydivorans]|uniref:M20 family metallopeptidase n=2 Tax=Terrabacter carboxydivorans TaxID=619730 RepID=A0ABN3MLQ7_9MICO
MNDRFAQAAAQQDWMVTHRRHLHRHPEVGIELPDTHAYVARTLTDLGLDVETHPAAGVTARVTGTDPNGVVSILRADLDALPVTERTGLDFASETPGAMHACGHDLHTAMLLGAAKVLADHPPRRDTVLVFQPGEESDRGALAVLQHASLDLAAATAFALHVHATADPGTVLCRPDVFMAFGDWFTIELAGPGGHASQPHLVGNPIDAAGEITAELRRVTAELSDSELVVATVTESRIGNTVNVIPSSGRLRGTIRSLSPQSRSSLIDRMHQIVADVARALELQGDLTIHEGYPAVVNDAAFTGRLVEQLEQLDGLSVARMTEPSMVIEDFAYFLQRWPGAMVYLGARGAGNTSFNHADDVVYDESVLTIGAALQLLVADGL